MGKQQFNAKCGCDWCAEQGIFYEGSMRYPYLVPLPLEWNRENNIAFAKEALSTGKPIFIIKSASSLLNLEGFDIIRGIVPDYMHCVLAGVTAQLTESILCTLSKDDIYQ